MVLSALILGLIGSVHCVGMCGPLACMVGGKQGKQVLRNRGVYHLGRITIYGLMGGVVGLLGQVVHWGRLQNSLSVLVGIGILVLLLIPRIQYRLLASISKPVMKLKSGISGMLTKKTLKSAWLLGAFNGLLPCGLVYAALAVALVQPSLVYSIAAMILFGLGTIPALLFFTYSAGSLIRVFPKSVRKVQTAFLVLIATMLIWRGITFDMGLSHSFETSVTTCVSKN
jgi:uncharacterized protein